MNYENRGTRILKVGGWIVAGVAIAAVTAFLFGAIVMLLWNWLMPSIFGLGEISYLQAWGLVLLSHILFKSGHSGPGKRGGRYNNRFEGRGHGSRGHGGRGQGRRWKHKHDEDWKKEFFSKMHNHENEKHVSDDNKDSED